MKISDTRHAVCALQQLRKMKYSKLAICENLALYAILLNCREGPEKAVLPAMESSEAGGCCLHTQFLRRWRSYKPRTSSGKV